MYNFKARHDELPSCALKEGQEKGQDGKDIITWPLAEERKAQCDSAQKGGQFACFTCSKGPIQEDVLGTLIRHLGPFTHVITSTFGPSSP